MKTDHERNLMENEHGRPTCILIIVGLVVRCILNLMHLIKTCLPFHEFESDFECPFLKCYAPSLNVNDSF